MIPQKLNGMEYICGTIFSVRFEARMNTDFGRYGISAIAADTFSSFRTIERYCGEQAANTLVYIYIIIIISRASF